jgi:hypothetical protein
VIERDGLRHRETDCGFVILCIPLLLLLRVTRTQIVRLLTGSIFPARDESLRASDR